jgi:hypothetical protein
VSANEYGREVPAEDTDDIPDVADDSSPERTRVPDDPEEPALPGDEPVAVDAPGTTVEEQLEGESLDDKLARERED